MPASLEDLWDELARGRVYECRLRDSQWHLDGLRDGENVYLDPRPAVLESLLHELMHRRHPRWGERRVTRDARRLLAGMREPDMRKWWRAYQRIKRLGRPVDTEA